jgi:hypothetical protein
MRDGGGGARASSIDSRTESRSVTPCGGIRHRRRGLTVGVRSGREPMLWNRQVMILADFERYGGTGQAGCPRHR